MENKKLKWIVDGKELPADANFQVESIKDLTERKCKWSKEITIPATIDEVIINAEILSANEDGITLKLDDSYKDRMNEIMFAKSILILGRAGNKNAKK